MICASSFIGVFIVLIFLALAMELITRVFPHKVAAISASTGADDAAIFAAITSTYARLYPGTRISNIEEIKNQPK